MSAACVGGMMKKLLIWAIMAVSAFGADAANDVILSQRKADNSGSIQRNLSPTARGFWTFDGSKIPASTTDFTYTSPTLSAPVSFLISGAGDVTMNAYGVGGASDKNVYLNTTGGGWGHVGIGQFASGASAIPMPGAPNYYAKQLHIADYAGAGVFVDCVAGAAVYDGRFTGNVPLSPTAPGANVYIMLLRATAYDGTSYAPASQQFGDAGIRFRTTQAWSSTAHGMSQEFIITQNGSVTSSNVFGLNGAGNGQATFAPVQPISVATTPGTTAGTGFSFVGSVGGNTTIATTGVGGIGSAVSFTAGAGGTAAAATTASTGGAGGGITLTTGAGGAAAVTGSGTGTGGNAGTFTTSTGNGGAASTSTGVNVGGTGGAWTFTTGNGGAATNGSSNTGGAAGNITLTTGNGGAGATAAGNSGTLTLTTGTAGSGGTVGNILIKPGNVNGLTLSTTAMTVNSTLTVTASNTTEATSSSAAAVTTLGGLGVAKKIYANTAVIDGSAATTFTGGAGNMTITAGTGASRQLIFQTTTSGSTATEAGRFTAAQHLLLGGLTTDGTGVLQFPSATTSAGGIAFGTDTTLYRTSAGVLKLDGSSNAAMEFDGSGGGTQAFTFRQSGTIVGQVGMFSGTSLILKTGASVTALTLTSTQAATFASTITTAAPSAASAAAWTLGDVSGGNIRVGIAGTTYNIPTTGANGATRVTADVTNATATMSNLTNLSFTVASGVHYVGTIQLFGVDSTNVDGLQFDVGGGSATFTDLQFGFAAQPVGSTLGTITSTAATTPVNLTVVSTSDAVYTITFGFTCNAGGTFIPRFAQNTHSTGTATIRKNSFMAIEASSN